MQFDGGDHFDRDGGGLAVQDAIHESARTCAVAAFASGRGRVALSAKMTPAAALVALDVSQPPMLIIWIAKWDSGFDANKNDTFQAQS